MWHPRSSFPSHRLLFPHPSVYLLLVVFRVGKHECNTWTIYISYPHTQLPSGSKSKHFSSIQHCLKQSSSPSFPTSKPDLPWDMRYDLSSPMIVIVILSMLALAPLSAVCEEPHSSGWGECFVGGEGGFFFLLCSFFFKKKKERDKERKSFSLPQLLPPL